MESSPDQSDLSIVKFVTHVVVKYNVNHTIDIPFPVEKYLHITIADSVLLYWNTTNLIRI
jgi:hypothetical protein